MPDIYYPPVHVGDQVIAFEIGAVSWPDDQEYVTGTVTYVYDPTHFRFMPDHPDQTHNSEGQDAHRFDDKLGWHIHYGTDQYTVTDYYVIQEWL